MASSRKDKGHCIASDTRGVSKGDRIAIILENRHEWCASYLGVLMAGAIAVPMDAQLGANEVRNLLYDSGAVLVVHSDRQRQM